MTKKQVEDDIPTLDCGHRDTLAHAMAGFAAHGMQQLGVNPLHARAFISVLTVEFEEFFKLHGIKEVRALDISPEQAAEMTVRANDNFEKAITATIDKIVKDGRVQVIDLRHSPGVVVAPVDLDE